MKFVSFILMFLMLLTSCGGGESMETINSSFPIVTSTSDLKKVEEIFKKSDVVCGETICPNNVAKLTFYEKKFSEYNFGVCSGTLISPGLILTNAHCVPESISMPGADCSEKIQIKFPPRLRSGKSEMVKCKRVRSIYDQEKGQPDMALLEVESSIIKRDSSTISQAEEEYGEVVHAFTMNPQQNKLHGVIRRKECLLIEENNFFENDFSGSGAILTLGKRTESDCDIISGNSGSGLFNESGMLIGALFAKVEAPKVKKVFKDLGFTISWRYNPHFLGMAANINCFQGFDLHEPANCPSKKNEEITSIAEFFDELKENTMLNSVDDSQLVVTVDSFLRYGVALKPTSVAATNRMQGEFMYMDFNEYMKAEQSGEGVIADRSSFKVISN